MLTFYYTFHITFQGFLIHTAFFFHGDLSRTKSVFYGSTDATDVTDVTDLLTSPNWRHHSLGLNKGTMMLMFALVPE